MLRNNGQRWVQIICNVLLSLAGIGWGVYLRAVGDELWQLKSLYIPTLIVSVTFWVSYRNLIKPLRDFYPIAESFLDTQGGSLIAIGKKDRVKPRVNILLIYRPWYWPKRRLRIVWGLEMKSQPDVGISFPIDKGVAGEVCRLKQPQFVDLAESDPSSWGFSEKEIGKFGLRQLTSVYSYPIYEMGIGQKQTGKVIGCVNFDTRAAGAGAKVKEKLEKYEKTMELFSELAAKVYS